MRVNEISQYLEEAKIPTSEDSIWCKHISIPLLKFFSAHPSVDRGMSIIIASGSGAIAFKAPFMPALLGKSGGQAAAVTCNFIANSAIFLDFRLSDGLLRSIKAERGIRKLPKKLEYPILLIWYAATFLCLPGGVIAQAWLTGENLRPIFSQICLGLGGLGFLATRGATFSRAILHLDIENNSQSSLSWMSRLIQNYILPIGQRDHLSMDEKIVDVLSTLTTAAFMVGGRWIWTDMYRIKFIVGLRDLGVLDLCNGGRCEEGSLYYITALLSMMSYFYFYFAAQDAVGHAYRFTKSLIKLLSDKGWSLLPSLLVTALTLGLIATCGLGSETGLVFSRVEAPELLTQLYFFMVNTPSLLKMIATQVQKGIEKGNSLDAPVVPNTLLTYQHPGIQNSNLQEPLLDFGDAEEESDQSSRKCCSFFSSFFRLKERFYPKPINQNTQFESSHFVYL